jgi:hypothetical protein
MRRIARVQALTPVRCLANLTRAIPRAHRVGRAPRGSRCSRTSPTAYPD